MSIQYKASFVLALASLTLALITTNASAQTTVFNNFAPGDPPQFNVISRYEYYGPNAQHAYGSPFSGGEAFTVSASGYLSTINIALCDGYGFSSNRAHLFLAEDIAGAPGPTLESFTPGGLPPSGARNAPVLLTSVSHPFLTAGTTYFLYVAEPDNEDTQWNLNSIGERGLHLYFRRNGIYTISTVTQGAFSVQVNVVPTLMALTVPSPVPGGTVLSATVTLSGPALADTVVGLSSSDSSVIRLHRAVVIPAGSTSATFPIITYPNPTTQTVTIQAALGTVVLTKDLVIAGG